MVFQRPRSEAEAEDLVDLLVTERDMCEDEVEEIAALVAPNKPQAAVELISELQSNPMISEPVLEYYSRKLLSLAA